MTLKQRKEAFLALGNYLKNDFHIDFSEKIHEVTIKNPWFVKDNIKNAIDNWVNQLDSDMFDAWIDPYQLDEIVIPKKVLIMMAGNIPLVGFHDFVSVIVSGHNVVIKLSSNDNVLMPAIISKLIDIYPDINKNIEFIDEVKDRSFDAVIATGNNNSARYFDYYFKDTQKILRKNRRSVAVLDGSETKIELEGLANDVFSYFGLGCRNVSKVFLPQGYDLNKLFDAFYSYSNVVQHRKYANNYDYNKTVSLMNGNKILDNGFLILKEDKLHFSPTGMLYYEFYSDLDVLEDSIASFSESIQCVISKDSIPFGSTQRPNLWDYADGIDTIDFLRNI